MFIFNEGIDKYNNENYCSLETDNIYRYTGYGKTKEEARKYLIDTLESHKKYLDTIIDKIKNTESEESLDDMRI